MKSTNSLTSLFSKVLLSSSSRLNSPRFLDLSDRILVMHEGKLKANLVNHNLTQEQVMEAALRSEYHVEKQSV